MRCLSFGRVELDRSGCIEMRGEGHGKRLRTFELQDVESEPAAIASRQER
jgi:hypothetical protein